MTAFDQRTREWYEQSYLEEGFKAQRLYPNEELLRFMGREFFSKMERQARKTVKVLELGCGSCSNLWMVAKEGFGAYGIDISASAIALGQQMLNHWDVTAKLRVGSMTELPYTDECFDVVLDIFSSNCLCEKDFHKCLDEVSRVLKPNGKFFSFTPSLHSDAFRNYSPAQKIDKYTLNGIRRETSPFYGNNYPLRFISPEHYKTLLEKRQFVVTYLETVSRTYRRMNERFEFVVIVGCRENAR